MTLLTQWNNSAGVANDEGRTLVAEWEQSSRREGGCELLAPRIADRPRCMEPILAGRVHHAVDPEEQRRSLLSEIAGVAAWAGKP
jgi:hypothetical protein